MEDLNAAPRRATDAIDSYGDIVDQSSWKLDRFRSNPVVLFGHNSRDLPIGKAESVRVEKNQLLARIVFASAAPNPRAEQVFQAVKEGVLGAVSVGFIPGDMRYEKRNGKDVAIFSHCELHELSVVPIPANPEALMKMRAKGLAVDLLSQPVGDETGPAFDYSRLSPALSEEADLARRELAVGIGDEGGDEPLAKSIFGDSHVPSVRQTLTRSQRLARVEHAERVKHAYDNPRGGEGFANFVEGDK